MILKKKVLLEWKIILFFSLRHLDHDTEKRIQTKLMEILCNYFSLPDLLVFYFQKQIYLRSIKMGEETMNTFINNSDMYTNW